MNNNNTKEKQYQQFLDDYENKGPVFIGMSYSSIWRNDPKYLAFKLARYKFVAKMLEGCDRVLEIGCGEAFGSQIVAQSVNKLICTDFDPIFIKFCNEHRTESISEFHTVNFVSESPFSGLNAIFALDVLEHISKTDEDSFLKNITLSLNHQNGICLLGMPSLESQQYTADHNKEGHVNCKSGKDFKELMQKYFNNVFMFSANDEVVHTGFFPMSNYLFALCTGVKP